MFCIVLILVLQIYYCSAECNCPHVIPNYAIILMGLTIGVLFISTLILAVAVYKLRQNNGSDRTFFGKPKLSINKYERQLSENSNRLIMRDSINDDMVQLSTNDTLDEDSDDTSNEVKVETEPKRPKIAQKPKIPLFPQMPEEQINKICEAVLSRHRKKEFTSLSELDKIVSDGKAGNSKNFDTSASTPDLDVVDEPSPIPIKKLPVFDVNSKESKLREEMKAMFSQVEFKFKLNKGNINLENNDKNSKSEYVNIPKDNVKSEVDKIKNKVSFKVDLMSRAAEDKEALIENPQETEMKSKQVEKNSKRMNLEILSKFNGDFLSQTKLDGDDDSKPKDENADLDEIYDCPPPPKPQNEEYDFLPPKKTDGAYNIETSPNTCDDLYDFPPSPIPHNTVYDIVSPSQRNRIVSDENATGYLFPLTGSNVDLFGGPQYSNAKTMPDENILQTI